MEKEMLNILQISWVNFDFYTYFTVQCTPILLIYCVISFLQMHNIANCIYFE